MKLTRAEDIARTPFGAACRACGIACPEGEYRFDHTRKWRFDYAWVDYRIALEVEGAVWTRGRHTRGIGFVKDIEKYNEAAIKGWKVLRCTTSDFESGAALELVMRCVEASR